MSSPHRDTHGHAVVSSEGEELILVDDEDTEVGFATKADAHDGEGMQHRAFSVFLVDAAGRILLQRRHDTKRLWPGYWANSCCSHPRRGESMTEATARRLFEELGVVVDLEYVYKFGYHARFGELGSERELCWVFVGTVDGEVHPNATEIAEIAWVAPEQLDKDLANEPERFTPWLHLEWERLRGRLMPAG